MYSQVTTTEAATTAAEVTTCPPGKCDENNTCTNSMNTCDGHYNCSENSKVCLDGWTGVDCTETNPAGLSDCPTEGACKNGGSCFNKSCCCVTGYEGVLCESEVLECNSDPCLIGSTCTDGLGFYTCICLEGA